MLVPASALASFHGPGVGTQHLTAGFSAKKNANVGYGKSVKLDKRKFSKKGTLAWRAFLTDLGETHPGVSRFSIDFDSDIKFTTKGFDTCTNEPGRGNINKAETPKQARTLCTTAYLGPGSFRWSDLSGFYGVNTRPVVAVNGVKHAGSPTLLLWFNFAESGPGGTTFPALLGRSPAGSEFGQRLTVLAQFNECAGGVYYLCGPLITGGEQAMLDFETTLSRVTRSKTKPGKKRKAKSYVSARCSDGTLSFNGTFEYSNATMQTPTYEQPCKVKK